MRKSYEDMNREHQEEITQLKSDLQTANNTIAILQTKNQDLETRLDEAETKITDMESKNP